MKRIRKAVDRQEPLVDRFFLWLAGRPNTARVVMWGLLLLLAGFVFGLVV